MGRTLNERAESAKSDNLELERLIDEYQPYILGRVYNHGFGERDEAISVALGAFYEAVRTYSCKKGSFLAYAGKVIHCRLIDSQRKTLRQRRLTITTDDIGIVMETRLAARQQDIVNHREACHSEIEEFTTELAAWGIGLLELEACSPRHAATKALCGRALALMVNDGGMASSIRAHRKLPLQELARQMGVSAKSLERHRKYLVAAWLIRMGDYSVLKEYVPCGSLMEDGR